MENNRKIKQLSNSLQQKEKELYSIQRIGRALSSTLKLDELLLLIMKEITEMMDADRSTLYLVDRERGEIWSKIALKAEVREIRLPIGQGISGYVAKSGETLNIPDAYQDDRFDPATDKRTGYRTRSILCMPIWEPMGDENRPILGVLQVLNKKSGVFTTADERLLETLGGQVAISIANSRLYHQLEEKYREIDLLYEFERLLSSIYELPQLLEKILNRTLKHLQANIVLTSFPSGNRFLLASSLADGTFKATFTAEKPAFAGQIKQAKPAEILTPDVLTGNFGIPRQKFSAEETVLLSPVETDAGRGFLAAIGFGRTEKINLNDERKLLDSVAQKISRAAQLHSLRETLLQKERLSAIGQMMSTVVHDIRSPINTVYGFVDLMRDASTTPEERDEYAGIIRQEIQSMMNLATEVLDFSKGKTSILPRKSSAANLLKRCRTQLTQMCTKARVRLVLENDSRKLISIDEEKMVRVIFNIAKNAIEAMETGGSLRIRFDDVADGVRLTLSDSGPGIPPGILEHIFDSFVTSGKENGTGLGLAIVKRIVEEHKGTIRVESPPGEGAIFTIILPEYQI